MELCFQAEDGIRDYKVTGVQTCALPIWKWTGSARPLKRPQQTYRCSSSLTRSLVERIHVTGASRLNLRTLVNRRARSEERRVGKETGRLMWTWPRIKKSVAHTSNSKVSL